MNSDLTKPLRGAEGMIAKCMAYLLEVLMTSAKEGTLKKPLLVPARVSATLLQAKSLGTEERTVCSRNSDASGFTGRNELLSCPLCHRRSRFEKTPHPRKLLSRPMSNQKQTINFYSVNDSYGEFSNFAPYPIQLDSKTWPTSEHYFQAQKFHDVTVQEAIRNDPRPLKAAKTGRSREYPLRRDWESVKDSVMRKAVLAKFTQHMNLRSLLLSTGNAKLVEHTELDAYWADGGDGSGKNMLGRILMEVREELLTGI